MINAIETPTITVYFAYHESPIGLIEIGCDTSAVVSLDFVDERQHEIGPNPIGIKALTQVVGYFAGTRLDFDLPLAMPGTPFQQAVWKQLLRIPFGQTRTYQEIAQAIDRPRAVRAVGAANGSNPISLIVPCHRVIGSDGRLTGYGGGLWRKKWLLEHEASAIGIQAK